MNAGNFTRERFSEAIYRLLICRNIQSWNMTRFTTITNESILHINVLGVFIDISSSNEIDDRLIIKIKQSRSIKEIIKL